VTAPGLTTERLLLRRFEPADIDDWAGICADDEVMRWLGRDGGIDRGEAWRDMAMVLGHWELRGYGMFAVVERESGHVVGRVGPWMPEGWPHLEVGWAIGRPWWGQGFATEAARASARYAFDELGADYVIHLIADDNDRSQAVAERIGARLEGRATVRGHDLRVFRTDRTR
jgi:RimJ/RimL family protein N-acetyltransferase